MLETAMAHTKKTGKNMKSWDTLASLNHGRRSYSTHSKLVNNAFLVVFAQYERAFEELSKV